MNVCNHFCTQRHFAPSVLLYFMCVFPFVLCRIIFLFHKNGHLSYKAKVKPPRLDGQRVGVYSTRSPHRPNALGLTLAKLDKIEGKLMQKRFENVTLNETLKILVYHSQLNERKVLAISCFDQCFSCFILQVIQFICLILT